MKFTRSGQFSDILPYPYCAGREAHIVLPLAVIYLIICCSRAGDRGAYQHLMGVKQQEDGKNCIMRCLMILTVHQILLRFSGAQDKRGGACRTHS